MDEILFTRDDIPMSYYLHYYERRFKCPWEFEDYYEDDFWE